MKLVKQIIEKKLELADEFFLNRKYLRGIWQFYCAYNIAVSITDFSEMKSSLRKRDKLWKKWIVSGGDFNEKKFKEFQLFMKKDMEIIIMAFNVIDEQIDKLSYEMGEIHKPFYVGVLGYEFPKG